MPAAAVIPAPIAYIKVVAVKTSVVELWFGLVPGVLHWAFGLHALPCCRGAVFRG